MALVPFHANDHRPPGTLGPTDPGGPDPLLWTEAVEPSEIYRQISGGTTGADTIKASAGTVTGYYITNLATAFRYVKLYNKASDPTVGTDTPVLTLGLPPMTSANIGLDNPLTFSTGIAIALTNGITDADTGAPGANTMAVNIYFI